MTSLVLTTLSAVLILTSIFVLSRTRPSKVYIGVFALLAAVSILMTVAHWLAGYFTGNGIDEATIYHIRYGLDGAGFSEYRSLFGVTFVGLLVIGLFSMRVARTGKNSWSVEQRARLFLLPVALLAMSLLVNPATADFYKLRSTPLVSSVAVDPELANSFYDFYRQPQVAAAQGVRKNFVFIYAESLERTYFDQTIFPGLIKGLRELETKSTYFTGIKQVTATGWTVAGMTASQCGIPLFTPSHGNSMSGMDLFLSGAVCFGDLLRNEGYELSYMGGASTEFAGKGKFLKTHGFTDVRGRDELAPELDDPAYQSGWGLFDDTLLDMAYQRFVELSESDDQFGLFTLTLDTHQPRGHPSASCDGIEYLDGSNPMLNSVACSDYLISQFVDKIAASPYADETIIVVASDHLAMWNTAYKFLETKERTNLFMILEPGQNRTAEIQTPGSTLDIGATLLPFLGYTGEIGLGRNLLNNNEKKEDRLDIHARLGFWSQAVSKFWDFPKIQDFLTIEVDKEQVIVDQRTLRMPVLIELDSELQSTLRFQFDRTTTHKSLLEHRNELGDDSYFLLIDECSSVLEKTGPASGHRYCLTAGLGRDDFEKRELDANVTFSANEVRNMLGLSNGFPVHRVAHAGGGVDDQTYTNSFEALNYNLQQGFRYFEIDFSFTSDDQLVCLHDWEESFERFFGVQSNGAVTVDEFEDLVANESPFHKCTADSLADWMRTNSDTYLVTDAKERNIEALSLLLEKIPDARQRVIPQIYDPENIATVRDLGFQNVIWTLYRFRKSNAEVMDWLEGLEGNIAVTMPKGRAESDLPATLWSMRIPTYVHTINSAQEENKFRNDFAVTEIYTDFLIPSF